MDIDEAQAAAQRGLAACNGWLRRLETEHGFAGGYVFGSLIYKDGRQFGPQSDADLLVVMNDSPSVRTRVEWLDALKNSRPALEDDLARALSRAARDKTVASVLPVTGFEIGHDVHKSSARGFFVSNVFRDAETGRDHRPLANAGTLPQLHRLAETVLANVQKIRHAYADVTALGQSTLAPHDRPDEPAPKMLMRTAAMVRALVKNPMEAGAEYDINRGLDYLTYRLYQAAEEDDFFAETHERLSVRRGGRGAMKPFSARDVLISYEILYDAVLEATSTGTGAGHVRAPSVGHGAVDPDEAKPISSATTGGGGDFRKDSLRFFSERFKSAFPGLRTLSWIDDPLAAVARLDELLREPLSGKHANAIWWWRGGNLHIERWVPLGERTRLMNFDELTIRRVAASPGSSNVRSFVYVEAAPMKPTGLYETDSEAIARQVEQFGFASEEYGLLEGERLVTRAEYDDGATVVDGRPVDLRGRRLELRARYLTPYNFVVAAHGSPINNTGFDETLVKLLNSELRDGDGAAVERITELVEKLPLQSW